MSLLQHDTLLSAAEIKSGESEGDVESCSAINDSETAWLSDFLTSITLDDVAQSDSAVAYFVAGYIGRSIARRRKCSACKEDLVASNDGPPLQDCVPDEHKSVFEMADRGGLSSPSAFCFTVTAIAAHYYTAIAADTMKLQRLLAQPTNVGCLYRLPRLQFALQLFCVACWT